jgi:CxxC motif-containing protein
LPEEIICIACPTGCRIRVAAGGAGPVAGEVTIRGAACERGRDYAMSELVTPERTFTGTVRVRGGDAPLVPVRSDRPVPRDAMREVAAVAAGVFADAPVGVGDVVARDLAGGASLVATGPVPRSLDEDGRGK